MNPAPLLFTLACATAAMGQDAVDQGVVRGQVLAPDGQPVGGALVEVVRCDADGFACPDIQYRETMRVVSKRPTAPDGTFALHVPRGLPCRLRINAKPYAIEVRRRIYGGSEHSITLQHPAQLEIRIKRSNGAGTASRLRGWRSRQFLELFNAETDADGMLRLTRLAPGKLTIAADPREGCSPEWQTAWLSSTLPARVEFEIEMGATLKGRVIRERDGRPIPGAEIGLGRNFRRSVFADATGRFEIDGVGGSRNYGVYIRAKGFAMTELPAPKVSKGAVARNVPLARGVQATGQITDPHGRPLPNCYVAAIASNHEDGTDTLEWIATHTNDAGRFELAGLRRPELDHVLMVRHERYASLVFNFPPAVADPNISFDPIAMRPRRVFEARFVDLFGRPLANLGITLHGTNADCDEQFDTRYQDATHYTTRRLAWTDTNGQVFFGDLAAGEYVLYIENESIARVDVDARRDPKPMQIER